MCKQDSIFPKGCICTWIGTNSRCPVHGVLPFTGVMGPVAVTVYDLEPYEINLTIVAIQRRLYSMCKVGCPHLDDVMSLPLEAFYPHCQHEATTLQKVGEKLCQSILEI